MERRSPRNITSPCHQSAVVDALSRNFGATWDTTDSTHLLPSQPLKHIPRAWERKPQSPAVKQRYARKIWRRHDFPQTRPMNLTVATSTIDQPEPVTNWNFTNARLARIKALVAASPSPRKVVKKLCLHTSYGQSASANHWDQRHSTPLRKRVHQRLATDPALELTPVRSANHSDTTAWSDNALDDHEEHDDSTDNKPDELELELDLEQHHHANEDMDRHLEQHHHANEDMDQHLEKPHHVTDHQERRTEQNAGASEEQSRNLEQPDELVNALDHEQEQLAIPAVSPKSLSHVDELEEAVIHSEQSHALKLPSSPILHTDEDLSSSLTPPDEDVHSPIQRSVSAPPGDAVPAEPRQKPRVSDDTAILHAFLNRAAASKKPSITISKRESLTNRRDSDAVRLALASPAKPDVLADLDPNSPSPKKSLQQRPPRSNGSVMEEDSIEAEDATMQRAEDDQDDRTSGQAAEEGDVDSAGSRPMRRSIRSRNRVVQFPPLVASPSKYAAKGPNKITIRSAGTPVSIKRTDAQELSMATRTNTRKNKGGSIMPIPRLAKLANETESPEPSPALEDSTTESEPKKKTRRNVKWDSTLAYYQIFADDSDQQEARRSVPEPAAHLLAGGGDAPEAAKAPTPMKKARRLRTPSKSTKASLEPAEPATTVEETVSEEPDDTASQAVVEAPSRAPTPAPKKRRSRIATPAKGLLSAASLLPADILPPATTTAVAPTESISISSSTTKTRRSTALSSSTSGRSLAAPKKLTFDAVPTTTTSALPPPAQPAPDSGKENRTAPLTPNKKPSLGSSTLGTGIPPPPAFHKSTSSSLSASLGSANGMGTELAVPGLASPAKRRLKSVTTAVAGAGAQRGGVAKRRADADVAPPPGLASPAKRRVRARVL